MAALACGNCAAPALVDIVRPAQALDPEHAMPGHAVHTTGARLEALFCAACGAPQAVDAGWDCGHCGATLVAPRLADAQRHVATLGPALRAHAERPVAQVVRERLARQEPALRRQRERAAEMQAEADAALGGREPAPLELALPWWGWLLVGAGLLAWLRWG